MVGFLYLSLALGCWTVWAVLSARMGDRFTPLNSLLWTGVVSAVLTLGGFVFHFRQVRLPCRGEWWLLGIFCLANFVACFGYYAALRYLPGTVVLPLSHLYLVIGPVWLAVMERRSLNWQQLLALALVIGGIGLFLFAAPSRTPAADPAAAKLADPPAIEASQSKPRLKPLVDYPDFKAQPQARIYLGRRMAGEV